MNMMKWVVLATALAALPVECASAQESLPSWYKSILLEGHRLLKVEAEALEAALAKNPADLAVRTKLLVYYSHGRGRSEQPEARLARRRHILWLIEHHPASEAVGLPHVTIDPAGHIMADKDGYEQASKLWLQQVQRYGNDAAVLGNAARFFVLPDKVQAEALYKRAQQAAPRDPKWSRGLGVLYAISILGLDATSKNGFNPAEAKSDFARHAREELEKSADAVMVGASGTTLSKHIVMSEAMSLGTKSPSPLTDYAPLAEALLLKAQELDPANRALARELEEFRKLRRVLEQRRRELEQRK